MLLIEHFVKKDQIKQMQISKSTQIIKKNPKLLPKETNTQQIPKIINNINEKPTINKMKLQSKKVNFNISPIKNRRNSLIYDISPSKKPKVALIGDIIKFKKDKLTSKKSELLFFSKPSTLINFPVNKEELKVNLTNIVYNHLPIEEDFSIQIKNESDRKRKVFSQANWKKHTKGLKSIDGEAIINQEFNKTFRPTIFKTKEYLLKQEAYYTLDFYDTLNPIKNIIKTKPREKLFNKETLQSQKGKNQITLDDIRNYLNMNILSKSVIDTRQKQTSKRSNTKYKISNSILINKKMILLPNGKIRPITPIEKQIEKDIMNENEVIKKFN